MLAGLLSSAGHVVTLKRVGLFRSGAFYVAKNPCERVARIRVRKARGLRSVSLLVPGASTRTCGSARTSMTIRAGRTVDAAQLPTSEWLVGCVDARTQPAVVVLDVVCAVSPKGRERSLRRNGT